MRCRPVSRGGGNGSCKVHPTIGTAMTFPKTTLLPICCHSFPPYAFAFLQKGASLRAKLWLLQMRSFTFFHFEVVKIPRQVRGDGSGLSLTCLADEKLLRDSATKPSSPSKCHFVHPPWKHMLEGSWNFKTKKNKKKNGEKYGQVTGSMGIEKTAD